MKLKATHLPTGLSWEFTELDVYGYEGEISGVLFYSAVIPEEICNQNDALMLNGLSGYGISREEFICQKTGKNKNLLIELIESE